MKNLNKWGAWIGAGAIMVSLAGCADRNKNGEPDSLATHSEIANTTGKAVDATGNAMESTGNSMAKGADNVADATSNAVNSTGNAIAKGADNVADGTTGAVAVLTLTPKIKAAILNNPAMKGTTVNVDTLPDKTTIALRGNVKTEAQKKMAESVAKKMAGNYKVANQLTVGGKMAGKM